MIRPIAGAGMLALVFAVPALQGAFAATPYDGQWSLTINTERGGCDSSYHFTVDITNGYVTHPNLVKLRGRVVKGGAVRVSVAAAGKTANGSGRLTRTAGHGRWVGSSGSDRCSGSWDAQKF